MKNTGTFQSKENMQESHAGYSWVVWRQDDNGNRFHVSEHGTMNEAKEEVDRFESLGHKQTYWVKKSSEGKGGLTSA